MKKRISPKLLLIVAASACIYSCKKTNTASPSPSMQYNVSQTNVVADIADYHPAQLDPNLVNAWGLAVNSNGAIWVSANKKTLTTVYDGTGHTLLAPVGLPSGGAPTGIVFNNVASDFGGDMFIFAGVNGKISAWANGNNAAEVAGNAGAVYTGLTIGSNIGNNFLFASDFKGGKIDIFDKTFALLTVHPLIDPAMAAGFAPFNIQNIGGMLYVTYAKQKSPDDIFDDPAPGNGYVDIFKPDGTFVKRFASQGTLNSPWGVTLAPAGFAAATATILVGNFGDGKINVFDLDGNYISQLQNNGNPIVIDGLWALSFTSADPTATSKLYFTAGPAGETHGLLGYLQSSFVAAPPTGSTGSSGY